MGNKYGIDGIESFPLEKEETITCKVGKTFYRYVGEEEHNRITGNLPNGKGSYTFGENEQKDKIYFTDEKYESAEEVRSKMSLTYTPSYWVQFTLKNNIDCNTGTVKRISFSHQVVTDVFNNHKSIYEQSVEEIGGGTEYWYNKDNLGKGLVVEIQNIEELTKSNCKSFDLLKDLENCLMDDNVTEAAEKIRKMRGVNDSIAEKVLGKCLRTKDYLGAIPVIQSSNGAIEEKYYNFLKEIDVRNAEKILSFVEARVPRNNVVTSTQETEMENLAFISDFLKVAYSIYTN